MVRSSPAEHHQLSRRWCTHRRGNPLAGEAHIRGAQVGETQIEEAQIREAHIGEAHIGGEFNRKATQLFAQGHIQERQ